MALTTIEPFGINSSNTFTFGGVTATGNVTANNITVGNTVSVTGNVAGNFFIGNGSQLTGLPEGYANANVAAYLPTYTGNLASLQGNVTTTANISANYVLGNGSQLTGLPESYSNANVAAYLPTYSGNISADNITANTFTGNISGGSNTAGTVTASAQPNITSVGTLTSVSVTGNIDGGNIAGNGAGLTSIPGANVTGQVPNALVSGTVTTAAQPNITSVGTLTSLSSSGNITGAYILGNGSQLTGLPESYTNANVAAYLPTYTGNLVSLEGNVTTTANISGAYVLGNGSQLTGVQNTTFGSSPPGSPAQGDVWIDADTGVQYIYFDDGTSSQWAEMEAANSIAFINADLASYSGNISPSADVTYDLGSSSYRWRDLYLSGNTINLGGATIKTDAASGAIALIPEPTVANPNPSGMVVSPSGGITVVTTTGGEVSGNAIADAAAAPTAAPVPIDITTNPPTDGQTLIWNAAGSEFIPGNESGGDGVTVYANISSLPLSNVSTGSMAFVSSNNRLYLWNGVGWFNIALINTNPTITGGADATYEFQADGTPIVLTLTASDPEGIPLTWSYEVTSGVLGNIATISQANNVFTLTPSTDEANAGTFAVTFTASDGINLGTAVSSFTLAFGAADPYYKQSVLLSTTATNNGTNNTFVDSSTNNFTITRNGNATQGSFGPFSPAGWSGYFDGTGDYVSVVVGSSLNVLANTDFTIEGWCYLNARTATRPAIFSNYNSFTTGGLSFWAGHGSSTTTQFQVGLSGTFPALNAGTIPYNSWFHWAIVRNGTGSNNITVYIDGTSIGTITSNIAITCTGNNLWLGASGDATANAGINGYMSNFRWVTGTAVYTATFTPPTQPLTAVSGTGLLTLQNNRFIDNSTNNFAITRNGDTKITPFSPFNPTDPYDTSVNSGSGYFDGTGDVLVPPANNAFAFGTGPFCIEAWIYNNVLKNYSCLVTTRPNNGNYADAYHIGWDSAGGVSLYVNTTSSPGGPNGTMKTNVWQHFVCCRDSNNITSIFVDGVRVGTATITANFTRNLLGIADFPTTPAEGINGYISNLRLVKGNSVYDPTQTSITVPTEPVTAVSGTSLLLNATNANIYDQTGKVDLETVGDAKTSTAVVKYGTTSMAFDGTGDYLTIPQNPLFNFSADFTLEYWVRFTSASSIQTMVSNYVNSSVGWGLQRRSDTNVLNFFYGDTSLVSRSFTPTLNQWYYLTIARQGTNLRMWVDGVQQGATVTNSTNLSSTSPTYVGILNVSIGQAFNGYISDLRITQGVARYTTNFTPPTAQLGFNNPE